MFESSNLLPSEEISSKDVELKVEVCEPAGSRTDMWQKEGRKSAEVWEKNSFSKPQVKHHKVFNGSKNDCNKITKPGKGITRKCQRNICRFVLFSPA